MKSTFTSVLLLGFSAACSPASVPEEAGTPSVRCSDSERGSCLFNLANEVAKSGDAEESADHAVALYSEACEEEFAQGCAAAAELLMQEKKADRANKTGRDQMTRLAGKGCQLRNARSCLLSGMATLAEIETQIGHVSPDDWPQSLADRYFSDLWLGCEMEEPLACAFYADKSVRLSFPREDDESRDPRFLRERQAALSACNADILMGCTAYGVSNVQARPADFDVAAHYFWIGCSQDDVEACVYLTQLVTGDMNDDLSPEQLNKFCALDRSEATKEGLDCGNTQ